LNNQSEQTTITKQTQYQSSKDTIEKDHTSTNNRRTPNFGKQIILRLYDSSLIERLQTLYNTGGNRYDSKNHFITELIEEGLSRIEIFDSNSKQQNEQNSELSARLTKIEDRLQNIEKLLRFKMDSIDRKLNTIETATANIFYLSGINAGFYYGSKTEFDMGEYDFLPDRIVNQ
jgi:hypothetical protein